MGLFDPDWDAMHEDDHGAARHGGDALQVEAAVDDGEQGMSMLHATVSPVSQGAGLDNVGSTRRNGEEG